MKEVTMTFKEALEKMKEGYKVRRTNWTGYWFWDNEKETIMMKCRTKDSDSGKDLLDIRETQRVYYTLKNILEDDWVIAKEIVLDSSSKEPYTFSFGEAVSFLNKNKRLSRKGWNGKNQYIFLVTDISFSTYADLSEFNPYYNVEESDENACYVPKAIALRTKNNTIQVGWNASQADILATDWYVVN